MLKTTAYKKHFPHNGKIEWIGLRQVSSRTITEVKTAELLVGHGLAGDKAGKHRESKRQITLIQAEHLPVIASFLKRESVAPFELRRNLVISGINLSILKNYKLRINHAVIEITGNCAPCQKMEQALGFGGYNAMRLHGGVTASVIKGGIIRVGDELQVVEQQSTRASIIG